MKFPLIVLVVLSLCCAVALPAQDSAPAQSSPAQPPPGPSIERVKMGGEVMRKMLKHKVEPIYPQLARDNRIQGTVRLHIVVGTDGTVKQIEVMSGHPLLVQSSLDAVRQWKYKVTRLNGEAVEVDSTVDVVFSFKK
jgi:periplasmic protein TonB